MSYTIEDAKVVTHRESNAIREFNRRLGNDSNTTTGLVANQTISVYVDIDGDQEPSQKVLEVTIPEDVPANCVVDALVNLNLSCRSV